MFYFEFTIQAAFCSIIIITQQTYKKIFDINDPQKGGSFYLQSKIFRAKESLDDYLKPPEESSDETEAAEDSDDNSKQKSGNEKKDK